MDTFDDKLALPVPDDLPSLASVTYKGAARTASLLAAEAEQGDTLSMAGPSHRPEPTPAPAVTGAPFRLLRIVGRGGFGEVHEAIQNSLGRTVAVKRLREGRAGARDSERARMVREFRQEALTTATLEHPNIVPVYDLGADEHGLPLMAMKLVRGHAWDKDLERDFAALSLDEHLARHLPTLIMVGQAVAYAHSQGIIHRDLKPSQVMVGRFGEVMLMDWGLAVMFDAKAAGMATDSAVVLVAPRTETASSPSGTPAFMAPEQTRETGEGLGPWTDVYLLGGMLYFLLTGTPPHEGDSARAAFARAAQGVIEPPEERAPGREHPRELVEVAMRCLEPDPGSRLKSAEEFVGLLQSFLSGASRRRESEELAVEAERLGDGARGDYEALSRALGLLERASGLWRGNPSVQPLRERVLTAYAEAALGHGDLRLADVNARRLPPGEVREQTRARVRRAAAQLRREKLQRRVAIAAAVVLLASLGGFGYLYAVRISAERDRVTAALAESREARRRADGLVGFMIDDLSAELRELGRLEVLGEVTREAAQYFAALDPATLTPPEQVTRARSLLNVAGILSEQGSSEEAATAVDELRGILAGMEASGAGEGELRKLRLRLALSEFRARLATGAVDSAVAARALALADAGSGADDREFAELEAQAVRYDAEAAMLVGDLMAARDKMAGSLPRLQDLAGSHPESLALRIELAQHLHTLGVVTALTGGAREESYPYFDASVAACRTLLDEHPNHTQGQLALQAALGRHGYIALFHYGDTAAALAANTEGERITRALVTRSPSNMAWQREHVVSCALLAATHKAMDAPREALPWFREAAETADLISRVDRDSPQAEAEAIERGMDHAEALRDLGYHERAEPETRRLHARALRFEGDGRMAVLHDSINRAATIRRFALNARDAARDVFRRDPAGATGRLRDGLRWLAAYLELFPKSTDALAADIELRTLLLRWEIARNDSADSADIDALEASIDALDSVGFPGIVARRAMLAHLQGHAAARSGDDVAAARHFASANDLFAGIGAAELPAEELLAWVECRTRLDLPYNDLESHLPRAAYAATWMPLTSAWLESRHVELTRGALPDEEFGL